MKEFIVIFGILVLCIVVFYKNKNKHDYSNHNDENNDDYTKPISSLKSLSSLKPNIGISSIGLVDSEDYQEGILGQQKKEEELLQKESKKPMVWIETSSYLEDIKEFIPSSKNDLNVLKKNKLNFLIIDDSIIMLNYINDVLSEYNYNLIFKLNATDAIEYLKDVSSFPDLIICDIEMPNISGIEFIKKIKTEKKLSLIPVIFITSNASNHLDILSSENVNGMIQKPFSAIDFKNQIEYVLNRN